MTVCSYDCRACVVHGLGLEYWRLSLLIRPPSTIDGGLINNDVITVEYSRYQPQRDVPHDVQMRQPSW